VARRAEARKLHDAAKAAGQAGTMLMLENLFPCLLEAKVPLGGQNVAPKASTPHQAVHQAQQQWNKARAAYERLASRSIEASLQAEKLRQQTIDALVQERQTSAAYARAREQHAQAIGGDGLEAKRVSESTATELSKAMLEHMQAEIGPAALEKSEVSACIDGVRNAMQALLVQTEAAKVQIQAERTKDAEMRAEETAKRKFEEASTDVPASGGEDDLDASRAAGEGSTQSLLAAGRPEASTGANGESDEMARKRIRDIQFQQHQEAAAEIEKQRSCG
jgi:hypothetical protein